MACARGDVIRAIGTVGGSTTHNDCSGPTAAIIMHNPKDNLASYAGGVDARNQLLAQNSCGPENQALPNRPSNSHCIIYTNCQA
ncbi:MAG: hypothetical protein GXP45_02865 [bacterium]|nr:hypothetical protein [bacterium]